MSKQSPVVRPNPCGPDFVRPFLQMSRDPIDICMQCESRKKKFVDFQGYFTSPRMQHTEGT